VVPGFGREGDDIGIEVGSGEVVVGGLEIGNFRNSGRWLFRGKIPGLAESMTSLKGSANSVPSPLLVHWVFGCFLCRWIASSTELRVLL
jgi:hypothetical protein